MASNLFGRLQKIHFIDGILLFTFIIPVWSYADWRCSECGRIPSNGGYYCSGCGKWVAVADAELIETKNESYFLGLPCGDHWHVYKCPNCGTKTTIYIGNIDKIRRENSEEFKRNIEELDENLKKLNQQLQSCFIATATYESPFAPEVEVLRRFRDIYLLSNPMGATFVDFYYTLSPPIANVIAKSQTLKEITRLNLTPIVLFVYPTVIIAEIFAQIPSGILSPATDEVNIQLLPSRLVISSVMDNYRYYDPFFWKLNVGNVRSLEYNEDTNTISFALSGIEDRYSDRVHLYLLFSNLDIDSVIMQSGYGQRQRLASTFLSSPNEEDILCVAFNCGTINWQRLISFTVHLSSAGNGRFSITVIAQDPSKIAKLLEDASEFLFGSIISLVRLLGYSDTYATTYARYECTFDKELGDVTRIQDGERIKILILKPLINAMKNFCEKLY